MQVRVRFAPSPTGTPHVGNLRTALFDWLWARHTGGKFVLRVEDTDQKREVDNGMELITESLRFLGLDWDEGPDIGGPFGPYRQSERLPIYRQAVDELLAKDAAYYCYCTAERLEHMRQEQQARGETTRYDRHCRHLSAEERAAHERAGDPRVVRLAVPLQGTTTIHDFIHGDITIANQDVDDQVLLKTDGFPTYHLAVVVDDHYMQITHVLRGDDWIPSFPKHILLYQAFGWAIPEHGHVPNVLGPDKKKLSKRHGSTSVTQFRDDGYLAEAMVNYLARLGWAFDDKQELFTTQELIADFTLDKVQRSAAVFDHTKLDWMNGYYIRQLADDDLARRLLPFLSRAGLTATEDRVLRIVPLVKERIKKLSEIVALAEHIFQEEIEYDPNLLIGPKMDKAMTLTVLDAARVVLERYADFEDEGAIEAELRATADTLGIKNAQFFGALRVAIAGRTVSLPLMGSMGALGRDRTLVRVQRALALLS